MYERCTDLARKVMELAREEAIRFSHDEIRTEHVLWGLIKEEDGVAGEILRGLDVYPRQIRIEVEKLADIGSKLVKTSRLSSTPPVKQVIEYAIEECKMMGQNYVGTAHLLLGLIREEEGLAAKVLKSFGVEADLVRREVVKIIGTRSRTERASLSSPQVDLSEDAKTAILLVRRLSFQERQMVIRQIIE